MAGRKKRNLTRLEMELRKHEIDRKCELKIKRAEARWSFAKQLKLPLAIAAVAVPIAAGTSFAGTHTDFGFSFSLSIAATLSAGAGAAIERWRSRKCRTELATARRRVEELEQGFVVADLPGQA